MTTICLFTPRFIHHCIKSPSKLPYYSRLDSFPPFLSSWAIFLILAAIETLWQRSPACIWFSIFLLLACLFWHQVQFWSQEPETSSSLIPACQVVGKSCASSKDQQQRSFSESQGVWISAASKTVFVAAFAIMEPLLFGYLDHSCYSHKIWGSSKHKDRQSLSNPTLQKHYIAFYG